MVWKDLEIGIFNREIKYFWLLLGKFEIYEENIIS